MLKKSFQNYHKHDNLTRRICVLPELLIKISYLKHNKLEIKAFSIWIFIISYKIIFKKIIVHCNKTCLVKKNILIKQYFISTHCE